MLLMPGLLSSAIYNQIRRKADVSTFEKIVEAFIFTFLVYIAINISYTWSPLAKAIKTDGQITYELTNDLCLILMTLGYAIIFPLIWGAIVHHDLHMRLFRFAKLTDRTSRDTAWDDVFTDEKRYITIHLKDGRRIAGWPLYYSNNKNEGFIFLSQAGWINKENTYIETESHGVLISKDNVDLIEFMDNPVEEKTDEQEQTAAEGRAQ